MSYKLFTIVDGEIVINKVEILTIPCFTTILRRDKGSVGDSTGRHKLQAFKEFAYIYHMADIKSLPNRSGYKYKQANEYAKEKAGLPIKWKADKPVNEAVVAYMEDQNSLPKTTILNLISTYAIINTVVSKLRKAIEKAAEEEVITVDKATELFKTISLLIEQGDELPKLTAKLISAISQLELADDKENRELLRGPGEELVPSSADPNRQL